MFLADGFDKLIL